MGFFARRVKKAAHSVKWLVGWDTLAAGAAFIKGQAGYFSPSGLRKKRATARVETFTEARSRLGLTRADLAAAYFRQVTLVWIYGFFAAFLGLPAALVCGIEGDLSPACASAGFVLVCGGLAFVASFRALQIKRRELFGVGAWVAQPSEWLPLSRILPPAKR